MNINLKKAQDDLKSDEEIFADKEKEINDLKEMVNDLEQKLSISNRCLEASLNKEKEQQELMLQLQLQLDKLIQNKNAKLNSPNDTSSQSSGYKSHKTSNSNISPGTSTPTKQQALNQRAKTAPINQSVQNLNDPSNATNLNTERNNRTVYSSPAVFNLERFMQSFRARSQLLTETLEENDCVLQKKINSTFDIEPDENDLNSSNKLEDKDFEDENDENLEDGK